MVMSMSASDDCFHPVLLRNPCMTVGGAHVHLGLNWQQSDLPASSLKGNRSVFVPLAYGSPYGSSADDPTWPLNACSLEICPNGRISPCLSPHALILRCALPGIYGSVGLWPNSLSDHAAPAAGAKGYDPQEEVPSCTPGPNGNRVPSALLINDPQYTQQLHVNQSSVVSGWFHFPSGLYS